MMGLMDLVTEGVRGRMGERGVRGMGGCWSSLVGRGPQVTLRVLCCIGVEVVGSDAGSLVFVGCFVILPG